MFIIALKTETLTSSVVDEIMYFSEEEEEKALAEYERLEDCPETVRVTFAKIVQDTDIDPEELKDLEEDLTETITPMEGITK